MRSAALSGAVIFLAILFGLIGGLAFGGSLSTGQAEPLFWAVALAVSMFALGGVARAPGKWGAGTAGHIWLLCGGAGSLSAVALFCAISAANLSVMGVLTLLVIVTFAILAARLLPLPAGFLWLTLLAAALIGAHMRMDRPVTTSSPKPELAILSALPLFGPAGELMGRPSPAIVRLQAHFAIRPIDSFAHARLDPGSRLLTAQPRRLQPADLAAIDRWVREGGRAVILADPLLVWPLDLPYGDRRRPPVTSLLDPLLSHWGLSLAPAEDPAPQRRFLSDGTLLPVAGASAFSSTGNCRLAEKRLFALCRIGKGSVRLIGDADLLDDRLWLADPERPLAPAALSGDTLSLLALWLADPVSLRPNQASRPWIRDDTAMMAAMRWALLAGMGWAIMGAGVVFAREKSGERGK